MVFSADSCVIQALPHNLMIGQAKLVGGLYHPNFPVVTLYAHVSAVTSSMNKIWHSRLSHLSLPRLKQIDITNPCIVLDDHDCQCVMLVT